MRHDHEAGRIAHVVGVRFEGEAEHRDGLALHAAEGPLDLLRHREFARVIDVDHRIYDARQCAGFLRGLQKCQRILGKA